SRRRECSGRQLPEALAPAGAARDSPRARAVPHVRSLALIAHLERIRRMRSYSLKLLTLPALGLLACGALATLAVADEPAKAAAGAALDFSDFDDILMQSMEDTVKALEPRIGAKDVAAATEDA